ncbi:hypothetical protein ACJVDH_07000 [Pedobacter sp. AW1-32]|uniref:hypothetical protein n=1 Tax=Pedobacter sp. AW1-32 TaxID=3383026 RepID=UPI003FED7881
MKKIYSLTIILIMAMGTYAQKKISGKVFNALREPLESASINLKNKNGQLLSFTRSDSRGNFSIHTTAQQNADSLWLEVAIIGFNKQRFAWSAIQNGLEVMMQESEINLATVTVKNQRKLSLNGDTLSYNTSDFADKQDRSIGDVLKRMPGIDVAENGKISYNGKAISNFYIDGDNVLDDRYNIGTKSIPQGAVDKIQVIEKDQPIKMLRKNNMSDDVALNLVMKDKAKLKLMGDARLGLGAPEKYDGNVTAMLFRQNQKFVNNIRGNNTGDDPGLDLTSFNASGYSNRIGNSKPDNFLSAAAAGVPDLPQQRSLLNNAGLINLNNLYKLDEDHQFKLNFSYLYDTRRQFFDKLSETYLPTDTIRYAENQNNRIIPQKLRAQLSYNINSETTFLSNTLLAEYLPVATQSVFNLNGTNATQMLKQENLNFSNEFNYRKKLIGGNMLNVYNFVQKSDQPETLSIEPGLNASIINAGLPYAMLNQTANLPSWYQNSYASTVFVAGKFMHTYRAGYSFQHQNLQSQLYKQQLDGRIEWTDINAQNQLMWNKHKAYADATFEYNDDKFKFSVAAPISYNSIAYTDQNFMQKARIDRFFINPSVNLKYQTSPENYLSGSYSFSNSLGNIDDIYRGTILRNYRSLFANNAPLGERKNHGANLAFNYKKAITMFFFNLQAGYQYTSINTISAYTLSNNIQQRAVLFLPNSSKNLTFDASTSKYIFALNTTANAGFNYSNFRNQNLQNNQLLPFEYESFTFRGGFEARFSKFINWSYNGNYTASSNRSLQNADLSTSFGQLRQKSTLAITLLQNVFLNLSAEHLFTVQAEQPDLKFLFTDANVKYRIAKIKTDIELSVRNIGNIQTYEAAYLSSNSYTRGTYQIQGRIVLLKTAFNF